ncbi:MAG: AhpC/TSA family protein [Verrucomicrobiales bacterium]
MRSGRLALAFAMLNRCSEGACRAANWMSRLLVLTGVYHLFFCLWANFSPYLCFSWLGCAQPTHPVMWRGIGLISGAFGIGFLIAARSPVRHWAIVLLGFIKFNLAVVISAIAALQGGLPLAVGLLVIVDDVIWWTPFAMILWAAAEAHLGRPASGEPPLTIEEAADHYRLSSRETLAEASENSPLVLVFLRHFGCTFTRKILRELEALKQDADQNGARLVLVHMLTPGGENQYLASKGDIARIADPMCELYRAFGLGKGGFFELFGPRVWFPLGLALMRGCGMGHVAGDGLQLPGAFLFHHGKIVRAQRAATQAQLPDLPGLFRGLPAPVETETVTI